MGGHGARILPVGVGQLFGDLLALVQLLGHRLDEALAESLGNLGAASLKVELRIHESMAFGGSFGRDHLGAQVGRGLVQTG